MTNDSNDSSDGRVFEESGITHSSAHYLTAILHLRRQFGYARATDVAEQLRISRGAASRAIALLKERGWIKEDPHRMLELTAAGHELARVVERNYLILECFLEDILGVPRATAHEDACKIEHLLNPATTSALFRLIRVLDQDPALLGRLKDQLATLHLHCNRDGLCPVCEHYEGCIAAVGDSGNPSSPHEVQPLKLGTERVRINHDQ